MSPRNHTDCVGNDCDAVLSGEIVAGRYVQLAVERHLDDLEHAHQRGLHFDAEIAGKSLRFVEAVCTHQKAEWAGQPLLLSPNQQFILWNLTGGLTGAGVFGGHTSRRGHFRSLLAQFGLTPKSKRGNTGEGTQGTPTLGDRRSGRKTGRRTLLGHGLRP